MSDNIIQCRISLAMKAENMPISARVAIGIQAEREIRAHQEAMRAKKKKWIADARMNFFPGGKQPCEICGKYSSLCEAHHLAPLAEQYDLGIEVPAQSYAWLCPTHHAMVHELIRYVAAGSRAPFMEGIPLEELDAADRMARAGVDLLVQAAIKGAV